MLFVVLSPVEASISSFITF